MARGATLTARQARFVDEYLLDLNATQAAIRAGFSARTAEQQGPRLLGNVGVAAAIRAAQAERSERTKVDADWLLNRLAQEADADLQDLYDESGGLRPVKDWPPVWRRGLVAGIDVEEQRSGDAVTATVRKIKLSDRTRRLELIGRHVNVQAFRDQLGVSSPTGGPIEVDTKITPAEAYRAAKEL
ncbi:terminase small subunit [Sphingomonas sp.]|uniref:terminase small subunit n=1 Tax=Sphingomonas sp. TaxID=28214 RepID=UPI0025DB65B6|nr:terminase small subunit [Sphingomonas sp.]MBV9528525.1 terminase small subunit [Sphingomonas sp.]